MRCNRDCYSYKSVHTICHKGEGATPSQGHGPWTPVDWKYRGRLLTSRQDVLGQSRSNDYHLFQSISAVTSTQKSLNLSCEVQETCGHDFASLGPDVEPLARTRRHNATSKRQRRGVISRKNGILKHTAMGALGLANNLRLDQGLLEHFARQ